jgi:hypothetical protein
MFNLSGTMVLWAILLSLWLTLAHGMRDSQVNELRYVPCPVPIITFI